MKLHKILFDCKRLNTLPIIYGVGTAWHLTVGNFRFDYFYEPYLRANTITVYIMHPDGARFKIATETDDKRRVSESYVSGKWDAAYQEALDYISTANDNARKKKDEEAQLLKSKFEKLF